MSDVLTELVGALVGGALVAITVWVYETRQRRVIEAQRDFGEYLLRSQQERVRGGSSAMPGNVFVRYFVPESSADKNYDIVAETRDGARIAIELKSVGPASRNLLDARQCNLGREKFELSRMLLRSDHTVLALLVYRLDDSGDIEFRTPSFQESLLKVVEEASKVQGKVLSALEVEKLIASELSPSDAMKVDRSDPDRSEPELDQPYLDLTQRDPDDE